MLTAMILASLLSAQPARDFWIVTEADDREVTAVNVGFAFTPEGKDYVLASVSTVHRDGTAETGWRGPAFASDQIAVRCADQTFLLRYSTTSSGVADPIRYANPDGPFISISTDPKRQRQVEAVCQPRANHTVGFPSDFAAQAAYGALRTPEVTSPLPGPQAYPLSAAERRREAEAANTPPEGGPPPRIGLEASWFRSPGGGLIIGYAQSTGGPIGGRLVADIYSMTPWARDLAGEPILFVRRALDSYAAQEQIRWADSRTCPGLIEALLPANDLPLPGLILPLDEASRSRSQDAGYPAPPAPHGPGPHVFWAPGRGTIAISIQFSTYGGPWVDWARSVDRVLEPCWTEARPVAPRTTGF